MFIGRNWGYCFSRNFTYFCVVLHGKQKMMEKLKGWGIAFVVGATLGMMVEQYIIIQSIKKDCEVLLSFRINDNPYTCKPYLAK